jgi:short-subunit dehydrogenase
MRNYKNVIITGASSGLGEAMAVNLAKMGANLTLNARRADKLTLLKERLHKINANIDILIVPGDVSHKDAVAELIDKSAQHYSGIDVIIANAGQGMWCRFKDLKDPDQLHDLMQLNYMGMVYSLFYGLPYLREAAGSFVAISSIQGVIPVAFHTGYVASKYAVNGLVETIRLEEPAVHFLLALPSWISGTELRSHALAGEGKEAIKVKTGHGKHATTVLDCAQMIIRALTARKRDVYIPHKYRYVPILRDMAKSAFDHVVLRKVTGQLKS